MLQWKVVTEALTAAGVDTETMALVEHARATDETVNMAAQVLLRSADEKQAKNYVKVEMIGLVPPFERVYVELVRPGGKTSHELRELLRDRLCHVRTALIAGTPTDAFREGLCEGIAEDLATEAP
jgi:hypothetical protein